MESRFKVVALASTLLICTSSNAIDQSFEECQMEEGNASLHSEVCQTLEEHYSLYPADAQDLMGLAASGELSVFKDYDDSALTNLGGNMASAKLMAPLLNLFPKRQNIFDLDSLLGNIQPLTGKPLDELIKKVQLKKYPLQMMKAKYWIALRRNVSYENIDLSYSDQRLFSDLMVKKLKKPNLVKTSKYLEWEDPCTDGSFVYYICPYTDKSESHAAAMPMAKPKVESAHQISFDEKDRLWPDPSETF